MTEWICDHSISVVSRMLFYRKLILMFFEYLRQFLFFLKY